MNKITIPYLKISAKLRKRNVIVDVIDTLMQARSILVFMPDNLEDFKKRAQTKNISNRIRHSS